MNAIDLKVVRQAMLQVQRSDGQYLASRTPGRAIPNVQLRCDLVGTVIFKAAASDFITGQTINIDDGRDLH